MHSCNPIDGSVVGTQCSAQRNTVELNSPFGVAHSACAWFRDPPRGLPTCEKSLHRKPKPVMGTTKTGRGECGAPQSKWIVPREQLSGIEATDETDAEEVIRDRIAWKKESVPAGHKRARGAADKYRVPDTNKQRTNPQRSEPAAMKHCACCLPRFPERRQIELHRQHHIA